MDLNQLLYHHQIALMAVGQAQRDGHLLPNFDLPRYYARRINEYRDRRGLTDAFVGVEDQLQSLSTVEIPASEPVVDYPVYVGDTLIAELLVNKALSMSPQERRACALENITDRLAGIQEELWVIGRDIYRSLDLDEEGLAALAANLSHSAAIRESEATHLKPAEPQLEDGITRSYVEQFTVGPYRYSNVDDARAALLRQRIEITRSNGPDDNG